MAKNIRDLIERLQELEQLVGPDAPVFCGGVQTGDRHLVGDAVAVDVSQHPSYFGWLRNVTVTDGVEILPDESDEQ